MLIGVFTECTGQIIAFAIHTFQWDVQEMQLLIMSLTGASNDDGLTCQNIIITDKA